MAWRDEKKKLEGLVKKLASENERRQGIIDKLEAERPKIWMNYSKAFEFDVKMPDLVAIRNAKINDSVWVGGRIIRMELRPEPFIVIQFMKILKGEL